MSLDLVRFRRVAEVVVAFIEPQVAIPEPQLAPWYAALAAEGVERAMICTVGPLHRGSRGRRRTVDVLTSHGVRVVGVTDDESNRGMVATMSYLGVSIASYPWSRLQEAARDVGGEELAPSIVRLALELRESSPAYEP